MSSEDYSSTSWGSESIPDEQPLPGCDAEHPIFTTTECEANVVIRYSTDRAKECMEWACEGSSYFERLCELFPDTYSDQERKYLHSSICTAVVAVIGTATGTAPLLLISSIGSVIAVILVRFLYKQLLLYMGDAHQNAQLLYAEMCEAAKKKFLVKPEHSYLEFDLVAGSMTLSKILANRSPRDRENCVDNVLGSSFAVGDKIYQTRDDSAISCKFNFFDFASVLKYFGSDHALLEWRLGGIAIMPFWYVQGKVSDTKGFEKFFMMKYGRAPPDYNIETMKLGRLVKVIRGVHDICVVLFADDLIPGSVTSNIYITPSMCVNASIAFLPSMMLAMPVVPVSIRQSYKKRRSSNNIVVQARPTLFRKNDGKIVDADINMIRRAWKGSVTLDLNRDLNNINLNSS